MSFERMLTYKGETLSVAEWARKTGLKDKTIYMRLNAGWTVEKTLEKPLQNRFMIKEPRLNYYGTEENREAERELIRGYLKTQPSHIEERREEGEIL